MSWQNYLQSIERLLAQLGTWTTVLPETASPREVALLTAGTFLALTLLIFLAGRLLIGLRRNRIPEREAVGSLRPLIFGPLTEALAWLLPISKKREFKLRKELVKAGYFHRKALEEYLAFRNAAVLAWVLFIGLAVVALADPAENLTPKILMVGLAVLLLIYAVPRLILATQSHARTQRIQYALPDALDMVNMTVTGGLPLRQAISRVGKELGNSHPDIACELAIVDRQAEAGSLDQALKQFSSRMEIPDITALAAMVRHAEQLGGNVATAFREFSDSVRQQRRQRAEERGNKASIKLLFPVVFFLAPPIYILLLGPAVIELRRFVQRESVAGGALTQSPANALNAATDNREYSASVGGQ